MATISISYRAASTITVAPQNVASSSTFIAGVESTAYDNTSNKDDDVLISGLWTAGTSPTVGQVLIYVFAPRDDTPTWPDQMTGSSAARSITSTGVGQGFLKVGAVLTVDTTTSNRAYDCGPFSVAQLFGGVLPSKFGLYISHNTVAASNSTAGNHVWKATGISYTVV
jgi:hypothetical protein